MPEGFNALASFNRLQEAITMAPGLHQQRQQALTMFAQQGVPNRQHRDWLHTPTHWWQQYAFADPMSQVAVELVTVPWLQEAYTIVVDAIHGHYHLDATLHKLGVTVTSIDTIAEIDTIHQPATHGFAALNSALFCTGVQLTIPADCILAKPLILIMHNEQALGHRVVRNFISLAARSQATVYEYYKGGPSDVTLTNAVTECQLAEVLVVNLHEQ